MESKGVFCVYDFGKESRNRGGVLGEEVCVL